MNLNKHAYLIAAHNQYELLKRLLMKIDSIYNDIFIHLDLKFSGVDMKELSQLVKKSNIYFLKRKDIGWGGFSQIQLTIDLLEEAKKKGNYLYYHYISGVDFPLKDSRYIFEFFNEFKDIEFLSFDSIEYDSKYDERIKYYWFFQEYERKNKFLKILNRGLIFFQKLLGINRIRKFDYNLQKGANWFSITDELVDYILSKKIWINKYFRYSHCADEIFIQTLVENSKFKNKVYKNGVNDGNLRLVDWNRGNPYVWRYEDKEILLNSNYIWARKFDYNIDSKIIDTLLESGE